MHNTPNPRQSNAFTTRPLLILTISIGALRIRSGKSESLALQHAIHHFRQRAPIVLPTALFELMLIDEEDVVLEARVEMWLEA